MKLLPLLSFSLWLPAFAYAVTSNPVPGGLAVIELEPSAEPPHVTFNNKNVLVTRASDSSAWQAWVGLSQKQHLGVTSVLVNGRVKSFSVSDFSYPEQHLTVSKNYVSPSAEELKRIRTESQKMNAIYNSFSDRPIPQGMIWPIRGPQSSAFGLKRFFNGEERAPHSGIDIAAPTGTPIQAPAAGKVVLTGHFFFNGKAVFIDHGQGLISMLCHMSKIGVEEGDEVKAGDILGKVGATGRVTGPHLHWTVSLNNARIQPRLLLADGQPQEPDKSE